LLQVTDVGICGSDLHWFSEAGIGDAQLGKPLVLGHEFSGVIESGARKGERVAVEPAVNCTACEHCLEGNPNLCDDLLFAGHDQTDGALREFMTWPERNMFTLPDGLTTSDGAMLEALGVALHSVDLGHVKPGMIVGVFGCGPVGLLTIQVAKLAGAAQIVATDKLAHRLEAAKFYGADQTILAGDHPESEKVLDATDGGGVEVAFEAAGENDAVETAVGATRRGGRVVLIGIPADDRTSFNASVARRKGLTISLVRRMKHTYPRAIQLVERGLVDVRSMVTHRYALDEYEEAFSAGIKREGLKIIINPVGDIR
jgi:L-iditol 2-dehydrogenase